MKNQMSKTNLKLGAKAPKKALKRTLTTALFTLLAFLIGTQAMALEVTEGRSRKLDFKRQSVKVNFNDMIAVEDKRERELRSSLNDLLDEADDQEVAEFIRNEVYVESRKTGGLEAE